MTDGPAALRVATWNIRAAIGPGPFPDRWWDRIDFDRLRAIGEFLAGLEADVIALQEVALVSRDGELVDNAGDLARQLAMDTRYGATRTFQVTDEGHRATGAGCFGNALLSRHPIRASRAVMLPAAPVDALVEPPEAAGPFAGVRYGDAPSTIREPRTLLLADVADMRVASTHFSHVGSGERGLQAAATVTEFGDAKSAVLLGDLNAPIEAPELGALHDWTDGFAASGIPPGDDRRISTEDGWRIDHSLVRGASVHGCRVVRESGDLSDHYPVMAEIRIGS